jgi:hypothetical protein
MIWGGRFSQEGQKKPKQQMNNVNPNKDESLKLPAFLNGPVLHEFKKYQAHSRRYLSF